MWVVLGGLSVGVVVCVGGGECEFRGVFAVWCVEVSKCSDSLPESNAWAVVGAWTGWASSHAYGVVLYGGGVGEALC